MVSNRIVRPHPALLCPCPQLRINLINRELTSHVIYKYGLTVFIDDAVFLFAKLTPLD